MADTWFPSTAHSHRWAWRALYVKPTPSSHPGTAQPPSSPQGSVMTSQTLQGENMTPKTFRAVLWSPSARAKGCWS